MHKAAQCRLPLLLRQPARLVAGRRYPSPLGTAPGRSSRPLSIFPLGSSRPSHGDENGQESQPQDPAVDGVDEEGSASNGLNDKERGSLQGQSAGSRRWRNRKSRDLPPIDIPGWFIDRNVRLHEDGALTSRSTLQIVQDEFSDDHVEQGARGNGVHKDNTTAAKQNHSIDDAIREDEAPRQPTEETAEESEQKIYRIHHSVLTEIQASLSGSLSSSKPDSNETFASGKSHLRLNCPIDGAGLFLERVLDEVSSHLGADVIKIDAQDLAEIAGDYVKEGSDASSNSLWSLGYDVQQAFPRQPPPPSSQQEQEEAEDEADEYAADEFEEPDRRPSKQQAFAGVTAIPLASFGGGMADLGNLVERIRKSVQGSYPPGLRGPPMAGMGSGVVGGPLPVQASSSNSSQQWNDLKLNAILEVLAEANVAKRAHSQAPAEEDMTQQSERVASPAGQGDALLSNAHQNVSAVDSTSIQSSTVSPPPQTILHIDGFRELAVTDQGRLILEKLTHIVQKKRKEGQAIAIVGTSASSALSTEFARPAFEDPQNDGQLSSYRSIVVTPESAGPAGGIFFRDEQTRIRDVNIRHLHAMVQRLSEGTNGGPLPDLHSFSRELISTMPPAELSTMLEENYLTFDNVHRIVLAALGLQAQNEAGQASEHSCTHAIVTAMNMLDKSDEVKTEWARNEQTLQKPPADTSKSRSQTENQLKKLKKTCNHHERSLLKGVVHTENIRTTFADVHAPMETIESLKNLTMLSLTRPEAFKYGVLATDKITGCLLYGPPGTGKTLLAKAVAKESGATVLEVSGSDVYDMYVGESEKNVRAIFSLAKKLSPCVVFIDEADAIFASRGSGTNRNSHRELINQFLREWDGMTDTNAFIMVATNRPFDLDDAALRRLPRRLLVDLPVEKDREAILGIHLREEKVDEKVSLADLAAKTPLYSGSDLKNMCVSAALAAVKEENDAAAKHNAAKEDDDPEFVFPERRTLETRHFEKAMEEITASVSEDMSSLGAIRKFDEKYGDRRGRKKKGGYGFTGGEAVKEDAAKVRG